MSEKDSAPQSQGSAEQLFNQFCDSNDFREILQLFNSLCSQLGIDPNQYDGFYPSLKSFLTSWKATSLFEMLNTRASLPEYEGQRACAGKRMLVVGAGPVGLRGAIELALLGARVDLVEKRPDFLRNNSLHLWPFLITDLRNLGAKKFYGRFASGSIDHICIRILQAILLKICLILGVKVHAGVTFNGIIEPKNSGWRVNVTPNDTPISSRDYDVVFAADGKKDSLPGFRIKEFRAKLALAITINFVNHNTQQENSVPEIGGVAFVYRQDFFNNLAKTHGIELENIVYYKDETHYFVMTVRKQSLLRKGVLKQDNNDPKQLLSSTNIDRKSLENFALEATTFATEGGLGEVEFERNHRGENDVALFDFTSLFAAANAARIIERKGRRLLLCLAGDSLINPFWPTGSGCARGFLGAFDDAWMIKKFCNETASPIELIEERESILYILPQTTPHRLSSNFAGYTLDPKTRYLNLSEVVPPGDVSHLYDTDNQNAIAMAKTRNTVQASTQDKPKPAVEESKSTIKRSKSSEVLSAKAHSATPTSTPSHHRTPAPSHPQENTFEPSSSDVKKFWQRENKKSSVNKDPKRTEKEKPKPPTKSEQIVKDNETTPKEPRTVVPKDVPSTSKDLNVAVKNTKTTSKETKPPLKQDSKARHDVKSSSPSTKRSKPPLSPSTQGRQSPVKDYPLPSLSPKRKVSPVPQQKESPVKLTSSKPPSGRASPKPSQRTQSLSEEKKPPKKDPSPSKLSKLFSGSKLRARSESPERSPKRTKKLSSEESKSVKKHPLQVSRSLQSLDKEEGGVAGEETQGNVLEIVKKYDLRAESLTRSEIKVGGGQQSGTQTSAKTKVESGAKGKGKKTDSPKLKKSKDKKEDKKSSKEGKGGFFSFFKSRKTYQVADEASKDKKSKKSGPKDEPPRELSEQSNVQRRIDQFKQIGLMTDGEDDTDGVVLVGVSPLREEDKNEERTTPERLPQSDDELLSGDESNAETVGSTEEGKSPSQEGNTPPVEEGNDIVSVSEKGELEKEAEKEAEGVTMRVQKLKEVFSSDAVSTRHFSYTRKRSKEIDLSDVPSQKLEPSVRDPLWLARVTQGMSKCLERLRKNHEIMVVKTALEIINTVLSNVQTSPENDVYRRVRVNSKNFSEKVWQLPEASQFLARVGWVEIDEFIVLPVEAKVDNSKRVLDKHLDIVNQMLWSRQLELPLSSGGVVSQPSEKKKIGKRSATFTWRKSYATSVVDESLKRIEEDTAGLQLAPPLPSTEAVEESPAVEQSQEEPDLPSVEGEEAQTIRAASIARDIWKQRNTSQGGMQGERVPRLISETELYGVALSRVGGQPPGVSEQAVSCGESTSELSSKTVGDIVADRLKKLNQSLSKKTSASNLNSLAEGISGQDGGGVASPDNEVVKEKTETADITPSDSPITSSPSPLAQNGSLTDMVSLEDNTVKMSTAPPPPTSLSPSNSGHGDQLKQLLDARPYSPLSQKETKNEAEDQPTDTQPGSELSSALEQASEEDSAVGPANNSGDVIADRLKKLNQSLSKGSLVSNSNSSAVTEGTSGRGNGGTVSPDDGVVKEKTVGKETTNTTTSDSPVTSSPSPTTEDDSRSNTVSPQSVTLPEDSTSSPDLETSTAPPPPTSLSPSDSGRGDQLKQLLGTRPYSPSSQEETKNKKEDQPKPATDAQHSTEHMIRNERKEYGNLTMEVAAQTREKWKQTEEALKTSQQSTQGEQ